MDFTDIFTLSPSNEHVCRATLIEMSCSNLCVSFCNLVLLFVSSLGKFITGVHVMHMVGRLCPCESVFAW